MFIGEYSHSIDDKGRLSVPVKFRAELAAGCVVTKGLDRCLWVYPISKWQEMAPKIAALPVTQKDARDFSRLMFGGASDLTLDKAGRLNLPSNLKEYASLKNKVIVIGMYDRLEIWPEGAWGQFKKEMEENSDKIAENLTEVGF